MCHQETKASMILQFIDGLRGDVARHTFEEGTWAGLVVRPAEAPCHEKWWCCDPRRNALLQEGNQNDYSR